MCVVVGSGVNEVPLTALILVLMRAVEMQLGSFYALV